MSRGSGNYNLYILYEKSSIYKKRKINKIKWEIKL